MKLYILLTVIVLIALCQVSIAVDVRLVDLDPPEAQQQIDSHDTTLHYAPKVDSNVPATRVLGNEPTQVLEDIYLANQYHGQDGLGGYLYGYSVPDIAKTERKHAGGDLRGAYNYISGDGQEIKVEYWDDGTGFHQTDNVPLIQPQQIPDTPEVQAAKEEHARIWAEQAERNSHPIEDPNANYRPGQTNYNQPQQHNYLGQGTQNTASYQALPNTPKTNYQSSGQPAGNSGQANIHNAGGVPQQGAAGQQQYGGGSPHQGATNQPYGGQVGTGQTQYQQNHNGGSPQQSSIGQQLGNAGKPQYGAPHQQYGNAGQQQQHGGAGVQAGIGTQKYGSQPTAGQQQYGSQQHGGAGSQPGPGQQPYGSHPTSGQQQYGGQQPGGPSGAGTQQYGSQSTSGQQQYGGQQPGGQAQQYGSQSTSGQQHGGTGQQQYSGSQQKSSVQQNASNQAGVGLPQHGLSGPQPGSAGQQYAGAGPAQQYGSQQPHGTQQNVQYSGQHSETKSTYASASYGGNSGNDGSGAYNPNPNEENGEYKASSDEEQGPPKGFWYNFDYPVGIIVSKQGGQHQNKRAASLGALYDENKKLFETQLKSGGSLSAGGSYQVHV